MQIINTYLIPILKPITYQYSSSKMVYESCKKQEQASKPGFCCPPSPPQNAPLSNPTKNYHEPQNALCCVMSRRVSSPNKCRVWPFLSRGKCYKSYCDKIMRGLELSGHRAFLTRFCCYLGILCRISCRVVNWRCLRFNIMKYCMIFSIDVLTTQVFADELSTLLHCTTICWYPRF